MHNMSLSIPIHTLTRLTLSIQPFLLVSCTTLTTSIMALKFSISRAHRFVVSNVHPFWILLLYFLFTSILGFLALKVIGHKPDMARPTDLDLLLMSVSAATVSSMSTVDMEVFSYGQFTVLALLMLVGGEVFNSIVQLHLLRSKTSIEEQKKETDRDKDKDMDGDVEIGGLKVFDLEDLQKSAMTTLTLVILSYLVLAHVFGFIITLFYFTFISKPARDFLLSGKHLDPAFFSAFLTISTFSSAGFVPINEGMVAFNTNSSLLLLLLPLVLLGNTLFPSCLRLSIWILKRWTARPEFEYLTTDGTELERRFHHLVPKRNSIWLIYTVVGMVGVQFLVFCSLEWRSESTLGMKTAWEKLAAAGFQTVNSRHAGESVFDLAGVSPAIVVMFIAMMYIPPYTVFLPGGDKTRTKRDECYKKRKLGCGQSLLFSHLSYIVIFIVLVCIIERQNLSQDPLNFNLLTITTEVVSAYGNVGFTMGYSCRRKLNSDHSTCRDASYGFVGRWNTKGKIIIIFIMFFGRLKKFNLNGGKAWKLSC